MLEPANPEAAIMTVLSDKKVSTTLLPENAEFYRVLSTGGTQLNMVTDEFLVTLESFAKTETAARNNLARVIARLAHEARTTGTLGSETCYGVRTASDPANYPMPSVPTHRRYLATLAVQLRRREVT